MRLIDADLLLTKVVEANPMGGMIGGKFIEDLIKNQPTAFDVDKFVEKLEQEYISARCNNFMPCDYPHTIGCCYDIAIANTVEIIKEAVSHE